MDHRWPRGVLPGSGRLADKAEERESEFWDAHVGPLSVMVLHHCPLFAPPLLRSLHVNKTKQEMNKLGGDLKAVNLFLVIKSMQVINEQPGLLFQVQQSLIFCRNAAASILLHLKQLRICVGAETSSPL